MKGSTNATRGSADVVQNTSGVSVLDVALQNSTDSQPGLMSAADHSTLTTLNTTVAGKQDKLTFDSTPTSGSSNPVTSGGVHAAINAVNTAVAGKQDKLTFDSTPTSGSSNPVTSGGVYSAINAIPSVTVDSALSSTSTNPVQNKVINTALSNKMDKVTSIGSSSKPIYINSSGVPTACSYSIGSAASKSVDTTVTSGSSNLVTSGAVYTAINSRSKVETPYFYCDDSYSIIPLTAGNTTSSLGVETLETGYSFGTDVYRELTLISTGVVIPEYGAVAINPKHVVSRGSSGKKDVYEYVLSNEALQTLLNDHIRTNIRGDFKLKIYRTVIGELNEAVGYGSNNHTFIDSINVNISDDGIQVISGNCYMYDTYSVTSGKAYLGIQSIEML